MTRKFRPAIYQVLCTKSGNSYIGSSTDYVTRWGEHRRALRAGKHHAFILQRAWNRHGEAAFRFQVIEHVADDATILDREQHWIEAVRPKYNSAKFAGSGRGFRHSEETKARLSAMFKGRKMPPFTAEHRERLAAANRGKKLSPETVAKVRAANLGRRNTPEAIARMCAAQKGRVFTEEHKQRLSEAQRLRPPWHKKEALAMKAAIAQLPCPEPPTFEEMMLRCVV